MNQRFADSCVAELVILIILLDFAVGQFQVNFLLFFPFIFSDEKPGDVSATILNSARGSGG